ncbi:unnamed protein product, partial [Rotaria sp. Silwood1]
MTCKNGGTCVPFSVDDPSCNIGQIGSTCCQCPPNFTGLRCEQEVDFCSSNPCKTNGRCLSDKSGYRCQCYEGYMGENCEGNDKKKHFTKLIFDLLICLRT